MTTFVLMPGAGGAGEIHWSEVVDDLRAAGHTAISVDIAGDDPSLGLPEYAAITDAAIGDHRDVVLVAQSMGGFTAPMIGKRDQVARIVFLNAMIPLPGETPSEWFAATGSSDAYLAAASAAGRSSEFDLDVVFLHDVPDDVKASMADGDREPASTPFAQPCASTAWPRVPLHVLVGADDRLFPADFQIGVARDRLGIIADVMPGGHLVAKSRPAEVAQRLIDYAGQDDVGFYLDDAADELRRIAIAVRDDQLDAVTPCDDWRVRDLVEHVRGLVKAFACTARHEPAGAAQAAGDDLPANWRDDLSHDLDRLVTAWRNPAAWRGESEAGGVAMPAAALATVALDELVLHAWDLSQATRQSIDVTAADIETCLGFVEQFASPEPTDNGLFGASLEVPDDAPRLHRLLALAGRQP